MQNAKGKMQKQGNCAPTCRLHFEFRILHYNGAVCLDHDVARSYASATRSVVASSNIRPMTWTPIGSHAAPSVNPHGTLTPGRPARLTLTVKMSARYICKGSSVFSPSLNGGIGLVGMTMTSACSRARA